MKQTTGKAIALLIGVHLSLLLALSLSCCKTTDEPTKGTSNTVVEEDGGGRPAEMLEALARGKKENKLVIIELFDVDCNFCHSMQGSIRQKIVLDELKGVVHKRITLEAVGVIDEFGLMESPTFLFFKPDGTFIEPFIQGFRSPHVFAAEIKNYKLAMAGKEMLPVPEDPHPDYGKG